MKLQINTQTVATLVIISSLAISVSFCAPSQQQAVASASSQSSASSTGNKAGSSTTSAPKSNTASSSVQASAKQLSSAASTANGMPSIVPLNNQPASGADLSDEGMDAFDGKNPFSDDSLWQIPVHLVRDLSEGHNGKETMAKSASETSASQRTNLENENLDDDDDVSELYEPQTQPQAASGALQQSSSSSPAVISASTTDLKTAAGYHYPTHGGHHASGYGGHHGGNHGGHYGGGEHYGGKYFQYASVPYPYAWEFGYRRGNPYHTIERYEHGKGPHFQTKVKWSDKHGGYGVHVWDYNHDDHHSHHYGGHYDSHAPSHYGGGHHGGHHGSSYGHH